MAGFLSWASTKGLADDGGGEALFGKDQLAVAGKAEAIFLAIMREYHLAVSSKEL
jgi:hypothetical protein